MQEIELTPEQKRIVLAPLGKPRSVFLEGPVGCGKTTAAVQRMLHLLSSGVPAHSILVWVPQRSLGRPYVEALRRPTTPAGTRVDVLSVDGLARRMLDLFWPLIAEQAGFDPSQRPVFLTLETAQYYMDQVLEPFVQEGAFGDVIVPRQRLISQILDNLNKAALVGFAHTEIGERLSAAWSGPSSRERVYEAVQHTADAFRRFCLQHNLLDFSLQIETFMRHVWPHSMCKAYLLQRYRHLIADNLEEDIPVAHDLLREWLEHVASALLVYDQNSGFRTYLGADPQGALTLAGQCEQRMTLDTSFVCSQAMQALISGLRRHSPLRVAHAEAHPTEEQLAQSLSLVVDHFHTGLLRKVVDEVLRLTLDEGVSPGEIAILAPFVDDALRFALVTEFERYDLPVRTHRPSRALRDEPAVRCLLTLAQLAHPQWEMCPPRSDVAQALLQAIAGMDWVRASYLTDIVYRSRENKPRLSTFKQLNSEVQERITFSLGARYDELWQWIEAYILESPLPLDYFFSRLFDELLARPEYGFHSNYDAAAAVASLIESVRKFRWALGIDDVDELGKRYVRMVESGVVAAQYLQRAWHPAAQDAIFIAPAYTFLSENRPVDYQFWLNVNSLSWGRRLYQPLTHPFVLTRYWPRERKWTDEDEFRAGHTMLQRVVLGLLRRCRVKVYLGISELNPRGREERGPLMEWVQRLLRESSRLAARAHRAGGAEEGGGV